VWYIDILQQLDDIWTVWWSWWVTLLQLNNNNKVATMHKTPFSRQKCIITSCDNHCLKVNWCINVFCSICCYTTKYLDASSNSNSLDECYYVWWLLNVQVHAWLYHVLWIVSVPNIDQFIKFFGWHIEQKICSTATIKDLTTPSVRRYTTLWNINVRKLACHVHWGTIMPNDKLAGDLTCRRQQLLWRRNRIHCWYSVITSIQNVCFGFFVFEN